MGPLLDQKFADRFEEYLTWIDDHHVVTGPTGRITEANPCKGFSGDDPTEGLYYHPVIVDGVKPTDRLFLEETFGPIVGVTTFSTLDEAIELANLPGYGLSSSIYTSDPQAAFRFRAGVSAGMVSVNNSTSGAEAHLPFGGNGKSGNGSRQSGVWVLDQFTRWQAMNWDYSGQAPEGPDGCGGDRPRPGVQDLRAFSSVTAPPAPAPPAASAPRRIRAPGARSRLSPRRGEVMKRSGPHAGAGPFRSGGHAQRETRSQ